MIYLKLAIVWGSSLERIRVLLEEIDSMYLGLFINSLSYKEESEGKKEKRKYLDSLEVQIKKINKEIRIFNSITKFSFGKSASLEELPLIDFSHIRNIVLGHKGDYPSKKGVKGVIDEWLGVSDSASALARKYTALKIRQTLLSLRISLGRFVESLDSLREPFTEYIENKKKFRPVVSLEIEKAMACYSIGLKGEPVFIIGRLLENLCREILKKMQKDNNLKLKGINIDNIDFDQMLNILYSRMNYLAPDQYTKAMSLKWDRNTFGHKIQMLKRFEKDAIANIKISLNLLLFLECGIAKFK